MQPIITVIQQIIVELRFFPQKSKTDGHSPSSGVRISIVWREGKTQFGGGSPSVWHIHDRMNLLKYSVLVCYQRRLDMMSHGGHSMSFQHKKNLTPSDLYESW